MEEGAIGGGGCVFVCTRRLSVATEKAHSSHYAATTSPPLGRSVLYSVVRRLKSSFSSSCCYCCPHSKSRSSGSSRGKSSSSLSMSPVIHPFFSPSSSLQAVKQSLFGFLASPPLPRRPLTHQDDPPSLIPTWPPPSCGSPIHPTAAHYLFYYYFLIYLILILIKVDVYQRMNKSTMRTREGGGKQQRNSGIGSLCGEWEHKGVNCHQEEIILFNGYKHAPGRTHP